MPGKFTQTNTTDNESSNKTSNMSLARNIFELIYEPRGPFISHIWSARLIHDLDLIYCPR